jgi:sarcosine oxidase
MSAPAESRADVAVIGGGIMGVATAWRLAARGLSVVLFEQFDFMHARGSSHGASRIFRLAYEQVDYVRLAQRALSLWREAEKHLDRELLVTTGAVDFGPSRNLQPIAGALGNADESLERIAATEVRDRFPWMDVPAGWEAVFHPRGGVLLADPCRAGLTELARARGVTILENTQVAAVHTGSGDVSMTTNHGTWSAGRAVIAAASWSTPLLAPLGLSVPLHVTREHVGYYGGSASRDVIPFIWHSESASPEFYGLPNGRTGVVKIAQHGSGPVTDPDGLVEPEPILLRPVNEFVKTSLKGLDPEPSSIETCLYATSPDDDFVIDRLGSIVLCVGFGGHGFKFAPAVGELAADLVTDAGAAPLARFAYSRLGKCPVGERVSPGSPVAGE